MKEYSWTISDDNLKRQFRVYTSKTAWCLNIELIRILEWLFVDSYAGNLI